MNTAVYKSTINECLPASINQELASHLVDIKLTFNDRINTYISPYSGEASCFLLSD